MYGRQHGNPSMTELVVQSKSSSATFSIADRKDRCFQQSPDIHKECATMSGHEEHILNSFSIATVISPVSSPAKLEPS
jgi:hypothetical protein